MRVSISLLILFATVIWVSSVASAADEPWWRQDPPVNPPTDDETELDPLQVEARSLLDSSDPTDWVRALTLLGSRVNGAEEPSVWVGPMLLEYLTTRSRENPDRTRTILRDKLMRSRNPGSLLLRILLLEESWDFLPVVKETLSRISSDGERRVDLIADLANETDPVVFAHLFPILAAHEPRELVQLAVRRLGREDEQISEAVDKALGAFLELEIHGAADWATWWREHSEDALFLGILERHREIAEVRALKAWHRANRLLEGIPPSAYRSWLLDSLAADEPGPVRAAALSQVRSFVGSVLGLSPALTAEQQSDILRPLLDRLQQIISGEASRGSSSLFQENAVRALAAMQTFRLEPTVSAQLEVLIDGLEPEGSVASEARTRLALAAVDAARSLRAPVGRRLDAALLRLIPDSGESWEGVSIENVGRVLGAIQAVGCRTETIEALRMIRDQIPDLRGEVLEVLVLGEVPEEARRAALSLFSEVLEVEKDPNLRTLAVNGVGRLGLSEGIEVLLRLVLSASGGSPDERTSAVQMIQTIGGIEALGSLKELLRRIPESDPLMELILEASIALASADDGLMLLELLLLDEGGKAEPWFATATTHPALEDRFDPGEQPSDMKVRNPEAFRRWLHLQTIGWELQAQSLAMITEEADLDAALSAIAGGTAAVLELVGDEAIPEGNSHFRVRLESLSLSTSSRLQISGQLQRGTLGAVAETLAGLLEKEASFLDELGDDSSPPLAGNHRAWLLERLEARPPGEGEVKMLEALRKLNEQYPMSEGLLARLESLERRSAPPSEETSEPDSIPVPDPVEADTSNG